MRSYQSVLILKPDIDEAKVDEAVATIDEYVKSNGGACLKVEKWGKKRLAYRVKKNRFGVYLNIYHTLEASNVADLEKKYKLDELVIKYMVVKLSEDELERAMDKDNAVIDDEEGTAKVAAKDDKKDKDDDKKDKDDDDS